jgi:hypothetical protein
MRITDEQFVVYLFSMFHRELGFDHIIQMQSNKFPDCTAVKDGHLVTIEFERTSGILANHLEKRNILRNLTDSEVTQTPNEIIAKEGSRVDKYQMSDYRLYQTPWEWIIRKRVLDIDYCVCWEINHKPEDFEEEFSKTKFIELSKQLVVINFMKERSNALQLLRIDDLTTK